MGNVLKCICTHFVHLNSQQSTSALRKFLSTQSFDIICFLCVLLLSTFNRCHLAVHAICILSFERGKTPDGYKHNRRNEQTSLWTTRQRTPWNGCNISKWEMKKISYLEWPIGKSGLGERDWWGNLGKRIWHWWNKHRLRREAKMSHYSGLFFFYIFLIRLHCKLENINKVKWDRDVEKTVKPRTFYLL